MVLGHIHTNRLINCCSDMSTIMFSDQSSILLYTFQWAEIKFRCTLDKKIATVPRLVLNSEIIRNMMAKTKMTPRATGSGRVVSAAAKHPTATSKFLDSIDKALTMFDDSISSISSEERGEAYKNLATTYHKVFSLVWDKINSADIPTILDVVPNKELAELRWMGRLLNPNTPQPKVMQEQRKVPELEHILRVMTGRLPAQKLPSSEVCSLITDVFSDLAKAHSAQAQAVKGLAELVTTVTPEQMTLILATAVPPTLQLSLPVGTVSPLSTPPLPPATIMTCEGHRNIMMFCKSQILPDPKADGFLKQETKSPTSVLAAALYVVLKKKYFNERTSRSDIASMFSVTTAQLTKAVMGVDYESGPHQTKQKRRTDADSTTPLKVTKTSTDATPSTSHKGSSAAITQAETTKTVRGHPVMKTLRHTTKHEKTQAEQEDMLMSSSSSNDSENLPEVPF